jgi:hypothetical protein
MQIAKQIKFFFTPHFSSQSVISFFTVDPTHITPYTSVPKESSLPIVGGRRGASGA